MFLNNLMDLRNDCKFHSRIWKSLRNISLVTLILSLGVIIFHLLCVSDEPHVGTDIHEFYGYGKRITYDDYDIDKKNYRLITSINDFNTNQKALPQIYGCYKINEKNKELFDKQKNKIKTKYTTNASLQTQTHAPYIFANIAFILTICSGIILIISSLAIPSKS